SAAAAVGDTPLVEIKANGSNEYYRIAEGKGALVLHELRQLMGDGPFCELMDKFGREHAGKPVESADFVRACVEKNGGDTEAFFDYWLKKTGLPVTEIVLTQGDSNGSHKTVDCEIRRGKQMPPTMVEVQLMTENGEISKQMKVNG